jgi:hypothetical protein
VTEFASKDLAAEWANVHKALKILADKFEKWSRWAKMPNPMVTALSRGGPEWYTSRKLVPPKFSWHYPMPVYDEQLQVARFVVCAVDFRNVHYNNRQRTIINKWFGDQCPRGEWELITTDHGTGPHIHVAYRDFLLRRAWEQLPRS